MAEELIILQKVFDMMEYGYLALAQFPKSEKYALATDIKRCMDIMLERCIEAQKKYYKKNQYKKKKQKLKISIWRRQKKALSQSLPQ